MNGRGPAAPREAIEAQPFVAPAALAEARTAGPANGRATSPSHAAPRGSAWVLLALGALGVLGLGVLLWLPDTPPPPSLVAPVTAAQPAATAAETLLPPDPAARRRAQDRLQTVLATLDSLRAQQAGQWARSEMAALERELAAGEKAYRDTRYALAEERYRAVEEAAAALRADIPARVSALVEKGRLALDTGDSATALAAFSAAAGIAPDDPAVATGLGRAGTLDQVLALFAEAESYERMGDMDKAEAAWRDALALDAEAPRAAAALARIARERDAAAFRVAMSAGLGALTRAEFTAAERAFTRAAAIDAKAPALLAAREQLAHARVTEAITTHLARAGRDVAAERWTSARTEFDAALAADATLAEAAAGRAQAAQRATLDAALEFHLARRERLSDAAVRAEVDALLEQARGIAAPGPRLRRQLTDLDRVLALATTPVAVQLNSDGQTAVSVPGQGELGRFTTREVMLLPGPQVAVGRRDGYRDVRVEFTLAPAAAGTRIEVRCTQALPATP